ncbi:hypothetical protein F5051DRAFT_447571 [Lentinula edodes]|nr:hypothetical protein F5051DRAFT_447571 [Lentinula edodes]
MEGSFQMQLQDVDKQSDRDDYDPPMENSVQKKRQLDLLVHLVRGHYHALFHTLPHNRRQVDDTYTYTQPTALAHGFGRIADFEFVKITAGHPFYQSKSGDSKLENYF